jgi:N-acetylglucosamine kinase-like BadF-type ATPase
VTRFFLGIDVGATKSHALVADETGRALGFAEGGPGNPVTIGYAAFAEVLQSITHEALSSAEIHKSRTAGAGFGIGGYDWPSQREPILQAIRTLGLSGPVEIVNDALIALLAGASEGWGVAVVAGTSCNCWGWDQNRREGRMTGFSWLGEAAGSHELVIKALQAVALEWTRRGPPTRLTQAFIELTRARDTADFLESLTLERIQIGPEAAPVVFQVAEEGDPVANELILWAGRQLGSLVVGITHQLNLEAQTFDVVLAGSFFNGSPLLAETMGQVIHSVAPGARLVRLYVPPVVGGVLLGMEMGGLNVSPIREALIKSTNVLLAQARGTRPTTPESGA